MSIAENRRARFDYHIEERYEAGMVLQGWEIKAVRAGQVQLTDGYVVIRDGAARRPTCIRKPTGPRSC
jgi:SsrA-binding protein